MQGNHVNYRSQRIWGQLLGHHMTALGFKFLLGKMKRLEYMNSAAYYFMSWLEISTDYDGDVRKESYSQ